MRTQLKTTQQATQKHKNKHTKLKSTSLLFICTTILLSGCSIDNQQVKQNTEVTSQYEITNEEKEKYKADLLKFIQTKEVTEIFSEDFISNLDQDLDELPDAEIKQFYFSNNAIYIQVKDLYMYRFQFNNSNKLDSLIVYNLEA